MHWPQLNDVQTRIISGAIRITHTTYYKDLTSRTKRNRGSHGFPIVLHNAIDCDGYFFHDVSTLSSSCLNWQKRESGIDTFDELHGTRRIL